MAIIVQRTGADASVFPPINLIEDAAAYLLPAATLHIALAVAIEGRRPALATALLVAGYVVGGLGIIQAAFDPAHPIGFDEGGFALFGLSSDHHRLGLRPGPGLHLRLRRSCTC